MDKIRDWCLLFFTLFFSMMNEATGLKDWCYQKPGILVILSFISLSAVVITLILDD